jgi:hypothetical protein
MQNQACNQMMEFNKAAFNNTFNAMALIQEQTERMMNLSLEQATMLPKEGKKVLTEWLSAYRKGGDLFKKAVEDSFQKLEAFIA